MRALAARMRGFAAKTSLRLFRRQFERAASELEEAAVDLESRSGVSFEDHTGKSTR